MPIEYLTDVFEQMGQEPDPDMEAFWEAMWEAVPVVESEDWVLV